MKLLQTIEQWSDRFTDRISLGRKRPVTQADQHTVYPYGLDEPLLSMGGVPWTLGDAFEHVMALGGTGSGKTSAVGRTLLGAYLRAGLGGLILSVKSDDIENALRSCDRANRLHDVMVINPDSLYRINFLEDELQRPGAGGGQVDNATSLLMEVIENRADGGKRAQGNPFFTEGARRNIRHSIEVVHLAGLPVTMQHLMEVIYSMPVPGPDGKPICPDGSFLVECMGRAEANGHDVSHLHRYFWNEMARPGSSRQSAGIISTFTNMADPFLSGRVAKLFASAGPSNWSPDMTRSGKIIILDLPVFEHGEVGRTAQLLIKKIWIDAMLRRQGLPPGEVPCFMLCDEYQALATPSDAKLMQAGRSSWVSALCLTQNLNNLYAAFEPHRAQHQAHAMLGNFSTLICCRNHDHTTNEWVSNTIGKTLVWRRNHSVSQGESSGSGGNVGFNSSHGGSNQGGSWSRGSSGGHSWNSGASFNASQGGSEQMEHPIPPVVFTQLAAGGPENGFKVQTIVFKAGKKFPPYNMPFTGQIFLQR